MNADPATALPVADTRATLHELGRGLRARPWTLGGTVVLLTTASVAALAIPALLGAIVDAITTGESSAITRLALSVALAGVAQGVLGGGAAVGVARIGERILADLRGRVVARALTSPLTRVEAAGRGDLVARVTGDARVVGDAVSDLIPTFVGAAFAIVVTGAGLAVIDGRMLLAALLAVPVQVVALRNHLRRSTPVYAQARAAVGDRAQHILEAVDAADTIRAMGWEARAAGRVDRAGARAVDLEIRAVGLEVRFWNRVNLAELVGLGAVLAAGFMLVRAGSITIGQATAAALYFHQLFGPVGTVLGGFDELQRAAAGLARLVGVLQLPARPAAARLTGRPAAAARLTGRPAAAVELHGVGYRYPAATGPALSDVDLVLAPGETVAVVGRTGAGKSTVAALVAGVLDGHTGRIVVDGRPVDGTGSGPGDRGVALVTQEAHVFAGTLRDDLLLARPDATDADLTAALTTAGALAWSRSLPDGLDTVIGAGGRSLSPFEAQRLALARSDLTAARVLVLDEATAEAGSSGTRDLDRAIERMRRGRTTLIVAHRLDQAARADRVVVLEHGRVVENGSHAELIALGGRYAELWQAWQDERATAGRPT